MPQITVYLRKEDLDAWKAIPNKSEFLHNAIIKKPTGGAIVNSSVASPQKNNTAYSSPQAEDIPQCCITETKCKHWEWDGLMGYWFNPNTNETNEAIL